MEQIAYVVLYVLVTAGLLLTLPMWARARKRWLATARPPSDVREFFIPASITFALIAVAFFVTLGGPRRASAPTLHNAPSSAPLRPFTDAARDERAVLRPQTPGEIARERAARAEPGPTEAEKFEAFRRAVGTAPELDGEDATP